MQTIGAHSSRSLRIRRVRLWELVSQGAKSCSIPAGEANDTDCINENSAGGCGLKMEAGTPFGLHARRHEHLTTANERQLDEVFDMIRERLSEPA